MSFIIKKGKDFTPAPEGVHNAVCVDVVDLGMVDSTYKNKVSKKHKMKLVWEVEAKMPETGKPFLVQKRYTVSLDQKATLRKDLKSWRGRDFTEEELKGFDIENVLGAPAQLVIAHEENEGTTYANVLSIVKASTTKLVASGDYKRVKDRPDYVPPDMGSNQHEETHNNELESEDIPF